MARTTADWRGIIVELDANETNTFLNTINPLTVVGGGGGIAAALTAMGVPGVPAGIIAAAIAVHIVWESAAIKAANRGDGVILTLLYGAPGVAIPSTRVAPDIDQNWVTNVDGTFVSQGGDRIRYHVDHGAVDTSIVRL